MGVDHNVSGCSNNNINIIINCMPPPPSEKSPVYSIPQTTPTAHATVQSSVQYTIRSIHRVGVHPCTDMVIQLPATLTNNKSEVQNFQQTLLYVPTKDVHALPSKSNTMVLKCNMHAFNSPIINTEYGEQMTSLQDEAVDEARNQDRGQNLQKKKETRHFHLLR